MSIRYVFFDAGDTLIRADPPVSEAYARAVRRAGMEADADEIGRRFRRAFRGMLLRQEGTHAPTCGCSLDKAKWWWREVVRLSVYPFCTGERVDEVLEDLWDYFARPEAWIVDGEAAGTVAALRSAGIGAGLISNWDARAEELLRTLGLFDMLEPVVVSYALGWEKPDPRIFEYALGLAEVGAAEALHVGDSLEQDVRGALAAGMRAAWLRTDGDGGAVEAPDGATVVRSLDEVLRLVGV